MVFYILFVLSDYRQFESLIWKCNDQRQILKTHGCNWSCCFIVLPVQYRVIFFNLKHSNISISAKKCSNLIVPREKYISAKISPPPPLLVGGAGVNFETLNRNCYFLLQIRSLRLKVRMICLKHFFSFVIDGAEPAKFKFFRFLLLWIYAYDSANRWQ